MSTPSAIEQRPSSTHNSGMIVEHPRSSRESNQENGALPDRANLHGSPNNAPSFAPSRQGTPPPLKPKDPLPPTTRPPGSRPRKSIAQANSIKTIRTLATLPQGNNPPPYVPPPPPSQPSVTNATNLNDVLLNSTSPQYPPPPTTSDTGTTRARIATGTKGKKGIRGLMRGLLGSKKRVADASAPHDPVRPSLPKNTEQSKMGNALKTGQPTLSVTPPTKFVDEGIYIPVRPVYPLVPAFTADRQRSRRSPHAQESLRSEEQRK